MNGKKYTGQSVKDFFTWLRISHDAKPSAARNTIYLQPLGSLQLRGQNRAGLAQMECDFDVHHLAALLPGSFLLKALKAEDSE